MNILDIISHWVPEVSIVSLYFVNQDALKCSLYISNDLYNTYI